MLQAKKLEPRGCSVVKPQKKKSNIVSGRLNSGGGLLHRDGAPNAGGGLLHRDGTRP